MLLWLHDQNQTGAITFYKAQQIYSESLFTMTLMASFYFGCITFSVG